MDRLTDRYKLLCEVRDIPHEKFYYKLQEIENFLEDNELDLSKINQLKKYIEDQSKIIDQKDEELQFAYRNKICIVKQLNDPNDYVLLSDYKELDKKLVDSKQDKINFAIDQLEDINLNLANSMNRLTQLLYEYADNCEIVTRDMSTSHQILSEIHKYIDKKIDRLKGVESDD